MAESVQYGLDGLVALVLTIGGSVVKGLRSDHRDLQQDVDKLIADLPNIYARRDDVRDGFERMDRQHREISAKLDRLIERG